MKEDSGNYGRRIITGMTRAWEWYMHVADGASVRRTGMTIDEFGDYWERSARESREEFKGASPLERGVTIAVTTALIGTLSYCVARMEIENRFGEPTATEQRILPR